MDAQSPDGHDAARTADDGVVIATERLTRRYGDTLAVDRLNLQVRAGEVFGLLGPNGAGKTTTILMILGLTEPTSGTATILGLDPVRHPLQVKRQVGYLPDAVGFYDHLTARQNLRFTAELNALDAAEAEERIDELLGRVRLETVADQRVATFSRGMRQRLGIADALVKRPRVLILDEPTIAIDPRGVEEVLSLIRWLRDTQETTVLLSSHLLHQVQEVCDRVGLFVSGRLVAQGSVHDLAATVGVDDTRGALDEIYRRYFTATDSTGAGREDDDEHHDDG